jgi:hypothetical protein
VDATKETIESTSVLCRSSVIQPFIYIDIVRRVAWFCESIYVHLSLAMTELHDNSLNLTVMLDSAQMSGQHRMDKARLYTENMSTVDNS